MARSIEVDKAKTAILVMDFQNETVSFVPADKQQTVLQNARRVIAVAREAGVPVVYVVVRFRAGYPEISPHNKGFRRIKERGILLEGTIGADIHADVAPAPGEVVVTKRRSGAFSTTDLLAVLNGKEVNTLVLLGIATSGVVLSTVRWAADMDYRLIVIADSCADPDEEVHRVLMHKVFPRQATVISAQEFLERLGVTASL